jgi:hypothetical protein
MTNGEDVHTPGYVEIKVEFYFISISMDNSNEDFWVQYYDGSSWNTVADFDYSIDFYNNQFYVATVTILESSYTFPTDMKIRFMCDASGNRDDIYVDDITITASTVVTNGAVKPLEVRGTGKILTGIPEEDFVIYPNPAIETLYVSSDEQEKVDVVIYSITGQRLLHIVLDEGEDEIDISKLRPGMYVVKIVAEDEVFSKKIIVR